MADPASAPVAETPAPAAPAAEGADFHLDEVTGERVCMQWRRGTDLRLHGKAGVARREID